nr:putative protein TPRXL [Penaeus vannamei]
MRGKGFIVNVLVDVKESPSSSSSPWPPSRTQPTPPTKTTHDFSSKTPTNPSPSASTPSCTSASSSSDCSCSYLSWGSPGRRPRSLSPTNTSPPLIMVPPQPTMRRAPSKCTKLLRMPSTSSSRDREAKISC